MIRLLLTLAFVALIVSVLFLGRTARPPADVAGPDPVSRYGFALREGAAAAGVQATHRAPTFDPRFGDIMPMIASTGAAVAVVDVDRDGWNDFYVTDSVEGGQNRLYRNRGDGTFEEVAARLGIADVNQRGTGASMASVWADYDKIGRAHV